MNEENTISPMNDLMDFKKTKSYILCEKINRVVEDELTSEEYKTLVSEELDFEFNGFANYLSLTQIEQLEKALNMEFYSSVWKSTDKADLDKTKSYIITGRLGRILGELNKKEFNKLITTKIQMYLIHGVHNLMFSQIEELEKVLNIELIKV